MLLYEFYDRYSELPIPLREKRIDKLWYGVLTPDEIYSRLHRIETEMKPLEIERDELLEVAQKYFDSLPKPKE